MELRILTRSQGRKRVIPPPEDQEQGNKDHSAVRQGDSELSEGESDGDEEVGSVNDPGRCYITNRKQSL